MTDGNGELVEVKEIEVLYAFLFARSAGKDVGGSITYDGGKAVIKMTPEQRTRLAALCEEEPVSIALQAAQQVKSHLALARQMAQWKNGG